MDILLQIFIGAVLQGALLYARCVRAVPVLWCTQDLESQSRRFLNARRISWVFRAGLFRHQSICGRGIAALVGLFIGWLFYQGLIAQIVGRSFRQMLTTSVMITLGVSLIIEDTTSFLWGGGSTGIPYQLPNIVWNGMVFPLLRVTLLGITILLTIGLHFFLTRTFIGRAVVAAAMNLR